MMRKLKKTLKALLCASVIITMGISTVACNTDNPEDELPPDEPGYVDPDDVFVPPDDGSEGIDWTKYWDGVSSVGGSSDNFKFTGSKDIGTLTGDYTPALKPANEGEPVIVSFTDGVFSQSITYGGLAVKPNDPETAGKMFVGWYKESGYINEYTFTEPVTSNITLYAKWANLPSNIHSVEGNNESLAVAFSGNASTEVKYTKSGTENWKTVDKELVRALDSSTTRVDILGLAAGKYDVQIGTTKLPAPVTVTSYDRSGYAHFNRKSTEPAYTGVGAYNDDGTLKDNALVIYVTEENKDTVMRDLATTDPDVAKAMFKIPGNDWGGKNADGIGWWLNNNQYTASNAGSKKNKVPSNTYDAANGGKLSFKAIDRPIVIRFLGTVTTPEGLTAYNDTKEGGGVGDNGHMARLKNLKNVTLEGVGDNSVIKGWGFHYVIGTDATSGQGTSFEVRNLTFTEYPEDAIGMEGQQSGSQITAAVARCWVHHNTFLPGYCANPAESDKAEGDGSCDFKRGEYYTCSYNYFEWCHKTNLIGSSDDSLQYNISMHHNMWYNCGSRIPLLRQSNCHFYNNYVCGDAAAKSPYSHISKAALSYVHSLRANCYMFSEANYYEGSKNVTDGKSGGSAKSWNDVVTQCFGTNTMSSVTSREQKVGNNCKYGSTDYSSFDTNPSQFYYDSNTKTTEALLDDPVAARTRVLYEAGALGFEPPITQQKTTTTPQNPSNITLPKGGKAKGEIVVFKLTGMTEVTLTSTSIGDVAPDLYDNYGRVWLESFTGTKTVILPTGTYIVASGQKDKESTLTDITFVEGEGNSEARVEAAKTALAAIPSTITISSEYVISQAKEAYSSLIGNEVEQIDAELIERFAKASAAYEDLLAEYVVKRIEYIGEVTADSYIKINAAQTAYNKLSVENQAKVTNYATLTTAWKTFDGFAVANVINRLNDLPDLTAEDVNIKSTATLDKLYDWFNAVQDAYNDLNGDEDRRGEVPAASLKKLTDGLTELKSTENFLSFKDTLSNAKVEDAHSVGGTLVNLYEALSDAQKAKLSAEETAKFNEIKAIYDEFASHRQMIVFNSSTATTDNASFWTYKASYEKDTVATIDGTTYSYGLKLDSSNSLSFTTSSDMTLKITYGRKQRINIDGEEIRGETVGDHYVVTVTIKAGDHNIIKGKDGTNAIFMVELTPAK
jgi:uncharacterized repeat protein (TIGR02543 family)